MTAALGWSALLGLGLWLIVLGQPLGRPRPHLPRLLRSFSARGRLESEERRRTRGPLFESALLERLLRPLVEEAGEQLGAALSRLGVETSGLDRRLELAWPGLDAAQFRGQQIATGLVVLALFPAMNALGVQPYGAWPLWLWLLGFASGFSAPA